MDSRDWVHALTTGRLHAKFQAFSVMGQRSLLMPGFLKAVLAANDQLKLYLSVLQAAAAHAEHPNSEVLDLTAELASARVAATWLRDMSASASLVDGTLLVPELTALAQHLAEDLQTWRDRWSNRMPRQTSYAETSLARN